MQREVKIFAQGYCQQHNNVIANIMIPEFGIIRNVIITENIKKKKQGHHPISSDTARIA